MKILIAGELNPDLILSDYEFFPQPGKEVLVKDLVLTLGSSSAICAVGLARLGNSVTFAANVGVDIYGDYCRATLEREGVDVSLVNRRADLKTGLTVSVTSSRDRSLITYLGAVSSLTCEDLPDGVFDSYQHFHVSSYFLQSGLRSGLRALFGAARRSGVTTSLDAGWDPTEKWSRDLMDTLTEVDVFLPNESELHAITGHRDVVQGIEALDNGHTIVIGKLGAEGCITRHQGKVIRVGAYPVDVVDTTGAGDSFAAGFLHAWLRHREMEDCLRFAAACGSLSTRGVGGTAAQPTDQEAENYIDEQGGKQSREQSAAQTNLTLKSMIDRRTPEGVD